MLPPKPPHDNEEPRDEDEEDHVARPASTLTRRHCVHPPKSASQYARCLREGVVLFGAWRLCVSNRRLSSQDRDGATYHLAQLDCRISDLVPDAYGDLAQVELISALQDDGCPSMRGSLTSFNILTFAVSPSSRSSFWPSKSSAKRCAPYAEEPFWLVVGSKGFGEGPRE